MNREQRRSLKRRSKLKGVGFNKATRQKSNEKKPPRSVRGELHVKDEVIEVWAKPEGRKEYELGAFRVNHGGAEKLTERMLRKGQGLVRAELQRRYPGSDIRVSVVRPEEGSPGPSPGAAASPPADAS